MGLFARSAPAPFKRALNKLVSTIQICETEELRYALGEFLNSQERFPSDWTKTGFTTKLTQTGTFCCTLRELRFPEGRPAHLVTLSMDLSAYLTERFPGSAKVL